MGVREGWEYIKQVVTVIIQRYPDTQIADKG